MNKRYIAIRVDGNEHIATGHIMRCLSIANACIEKNLYVVFIVSDLSSEEFLIKKQSELSLSFEIVCLHSVFDKLEAELPALKDYLTTYNPSVLIVDSYYVTDKYLEELNSILKVVYMDDLLSFDYQVDTVINYDLIVDRTFYQKAKTLLLGGSYAPLKKIFSCTDYTVKESCTHILVSTGGADPYGFSPKLLTEIVSRTELNCYIFHFVVGSMNPHLKELSKIAESHNHILLEQDVIDMCSLMQSCDLAITAGGTTLFELCAIGIPSVGYALNKNQELCALPFFTKELISYSGLLDKTPELEKLILDQAEELLHDYKKRLQMSEQMKTEIDGLGCERIVEALTLSI